MPDVAVERRESIRLAMITALQRIPPRQTAAVLLVDVLGFRPAEAATMLEVGPTAVKGLLQRARTALAVDADPRVPDRPLDEHDQLLADRFAAAFCADDIAAVVSLLTDDAWLAMPPAPHRYHGSAAIGAFLRASSTWRAGRRFRLLSTTANGQPAFGCYLAGDALGPAAAPAAPDVLRPNGVIVLTTAENQIGMITRFLDPGLHRHFGLPDQLIDEPA